MTDGVGTGTRREIHKREGIGCLIAHATPRLALSQEEENAAIFLVLLCFLPLCPCCGMLYSSCTYQPETLITRGEADGGTVALAQPLYG